MSSVRVIIRVDRDGKIQAEVNGVTGTGCQDLTITLLGAIGQVESQELKPEFFEVPQEQREVQKQIE